MGPETRRWGIGIGTAALLAVTAATGYSAFAQQAPGQPRRPVPPAGAPAPPPDAGGFGGAPFGGVPGGQPGAFPGGPGGFPGGPGFPRGPMMMGAPVTMTATGATVYVLRGNTLYAFDGSSLRLKAQTELPHPTGGPGFPGAAGGEGGIGPGVPPPPRPRE